MNSTRQQQLEERLKFLDVRLVVVDSSGKDKVSKSVPLDIKKLHELVTQSKKFLEEEDFCGHSLTSDSSMSEVVIAIDTIQQAHSKTKFAVKNFFEEIEEMIEEIS